MKGIVGNFTGQNKLWVVFWIHNFLLGGVINALVDLVINMESQLLLYIYLSIFALWSIWVFVGLWQCAFNAKYKFWGYLVRPFTILCALFIGYMIYQSFL